MTNSKEATVERDSWKSKWGFILACIGSAVGMGNIWLFPSRVAKYGGAFLVAYLIFDILIGFSGVIGEMSFGRAARSGPIGAFEKAAGSRGKSKIGAIIGGIPMVGALMLAIGYSVVVGWIFKYVFGAFTGSAFAHGTDVTDISGYAAAFESTASSFGNNLWLIIALIVCFAIMVMGVAGGIEKANKIMIPLFFLLFLGLAVYVAMQPGASEGYKYMFTIDPKVLKDPMMWVYALGQSFFSLSLAGNGTVIYGSYLPDNEDIVSSAWKVALFDTLAAFLAALTIVPAMAASGATTFDGGPGLMFIYLPNLFAAMPGGYVVMIVFFVAVLFAGLTSLVNLFEAPIATLQDNLHFSRAKAVAIIGIIGVVVALCIQGIVSGWMDFVSIYICPLGAGLAGIMFAWVWGKKAVEDAVSMGRKNRIGGWYYPLYKYGFCILTMVVFICGIVFGGIG
ncbi:sodium-dependent transporter [Butyricicoccus sp. Marseille-Q5471]|uniref:sodium-dependent transporter n=1 Tax=Butyricicoccus sp. Marseille-Q5471 TaxID=3039493 RepID=UPI0024BC932E|nr:sodium-dependent transporter [Butyricicoccus sp. Marseille-Q5471]